jgi:hypothetical protein
MLEITIPVKAALYEIPKLLHFESSSKEEKRNEMLRHDGTMERKKYALQHLSLQNSSDGFPCSAVMRAAKVE